MAKRRLNKNLVGFLTASGVFLAVLVVAIAAFNASKRDPEQTAEKARKQLEAGDPVRAIDLFQRAYKNSDPPDPKYLIEASRVAYAMGEVSQMLGFLRFAYAESPRDPQVLIALLERWWDFRKYSMRQWADVRDYAEALLGVQVENPSPLPLVMKSEALEHLKDLDPTYAAESDRTLQRAIEIDPTSPYVALVHAERQLAQARARWSAMSRTKSRVSAEEFQADVRDTQIGILKPALDAHPEHVDLRIALAWSLAEDSQWDAAHEMLADGVARLPQDPDLRYQLAHLLAQKIQRDGPEADPEQVRAWVAEALQHADQAIELARAYYRAYTIRNDIKRLGWLKDGSWSADPLERQKELLESYATALRDTVGLRTFRATVGAGLRLEMIYNAFDSALRFYDSTADGAIRAQAVGFMRQFSQEAQTQFPEDTRASLMAGYIALIDQDDRLAVKEFTLAEERGEAMGRDSQGYYVARRAKEQLTKLFRSMGELGSSMRYTLELIQDYQDEGGIPPLGLFVNQAELLIALDKGQEALNLIDSIATAYPEERDKRNMSSIRARILAKLGRTNEAIEVAQGASPDDLRALYTQAQIAINDKDLEQGAALLRQILERNPDDKRIVELLIQVLVEDGRNDEALQFTRQHLEQATDENWRRALRLHEVRIAEADPEKRKRNVLEILKGIPDEFDRAQSLFSFWSDLGEFEQATTQLDTMERLHPGEIDVLELQLDLALRSDACDRATRYVTELTRLNADQVGGAVYRGRYELVCGDPERALSEFRAAEREFPADSELKRRIAQALMLVKPARYDDAIQVLLEAAESDPLSFRVHQLLYACYAQTGRRTEGIEHLKTAKKLNPDDPFIKQNAEILEEEENPRQGIERREARRKDQPQDVANLLRLAELYDTTKDVERAEECLRAAAQVEPANGQVAAYLALFFAKHQNRAAGEQLLEKHIAACDSSAEITARLLLGRFYEAMNDPEAALKTMQQAQQRAGELFTAGSKDYNAAIVATVSEQASFFLRAQRVQEMIDAYRVALNHLDPSQTSQIQAARILIARGLMTLRRFGEAGTDLENYLKEYPNDPAGMMAQAELFMALHRFEESRQLWSRVLEDDPDHIRALYMRGQINAELGRYQEAIEDLREAKRLAPDAFNRAHRFALVRVYELMESWELAEGELRELLKIKRDTGRGIEIQLINLLVNSDQFEKAQTFVNQLMAQEPSQPFWPYQLGRLLMAREEFSAAAGYLEKAVAMTEGKNADANAEWVLALTSANRPREATQAYESLSDRTPLAVTPRMQAYAARAYLAQDRRNVAVPLLEQAILAASQRGSDTVQFVAAYAVRLLGAGEAQAILRRVLEHATQPEVKLAIRSTLARHLVASSDSSIRSEGLEITKELIATTSKGSPAYLDALLVQAVGWEATGRDQEAAGCYEQILELVPDDTRALNNLAFLLADRLNRAAEAVAYAERLGDLVSDDANVLDTIAWVYHCAGNNPLAVAKLRDALRIEPDNLAARYHLGVVYADNNQVADARRELERAQKMAREVDDQTYMTQIEEALAKLR